MTDEEKLSNLLLKWEEAWEQGEEISAKHLCVECPNLIEPLNQKINRLKKMAWMSKDEEPDGEHPRKDSMIGQTLTSRYTIESLIGMGGFGRVYQAFDNELQRHVALKVARAERIGVTDSLLQEARRAAKLRHPSIVSVHDVGRHEGSFFIVSDLIEGRSLAGVIERGRPSPQQAAEWIAEISDALQVAHDQGFVHRDIKPSNILIDPQGRALVTDFGISATTDEIDQGHVLNFGTLAYSAPEQLAEETTLTGPVTDLFALGVVFYQLLTGRHPFAAEKATELRQNILLRTPKSPSSISHDVPVTLSNVCLRCLAKHPLERFQSAAQLAESLRTVPKTTRPHSKIWLIAVPCALLIAALPYLRRSDDPKLSSTSETTAHTSPSTSNAIIPVSEGFIFDGEHRIVTPVQKSLPLTIEAWVRPRQQQATAYFVGSDIQGEFGMSIGTMNSIFVAQRIRGALSTRTIVPVGQWTHLATVFSETETRLYANGKHVETGAASQLGRNAPFVIGGVGFNNRLYQFVGDIRAVRISKGERFQKEFDPDSTFEPDSPSSSGGAILIYDKRSESRDVVRDLSGLGHNGRWEVSRPTDPPPSLTAEAFVFDGTKFIQTPVGRFAPATLEAWVMPTERPQRTGFIIGSDIPSKYGIGITLSPANLSAEYLDGLHVSEAPVPTDAWSHVAAVFASQETRLYLNGQLVSTAPSTTNSGGTRFVIGRAGEHNPSDHFIGQIRSVRISRGERYDADFEPEKGFVQKAPDKDNSAVLIYEGTSADGDTVPDLSGNGNAGKLMPN